MKRSCLILILLFHFSLIYAQEFTNCISYKVLDIEKDAGFNVPDSVYGFLDIIFSEAVKEIDTKEYYNKDDALDLMHQIAEIHRELGIETSLHLHGDLLATGLNEKKFDCGNYVLTYLGIAELLNIPLYAVEAPGHIFLHFNDGDGVNFYWETLYGYEADKGLIIAEKNISEETIINSIYLTDLDYDGLLSSRLVTLSTVLRKDRKYNTAISYDEEAIKLNRMNVSAYCSLGSDYLSRQEYDKAIESFKHAMELNSNWSVIYNNLGVVFQNQGIYDSAMFYFDKSLELNQRDPITYLNLSKIYLKQKDYEKALTYIDTSIEISLDFEDVDSEYYKHKGDVLFRLGKYENAIEEYSRSIESDSKMIESYQNRGMSYARLEDYDKAVNDWEAVIQIDSNYKDAYSNLGKYYYYIAEDNLYAIKYFEKVVELEADMDDIYELISIYLILDREMPAKEIYEKYIQNNKVNETEFIDMLRDLKEDYPESEIIDYYIKQH